MERRKPRNSKLCDALRTPDSNAVMSATIPLRTLLGLAEQRPAWEALEDLVDASRDAAASSSLVLLHGPSGSGKSFLVNQIAQRQADVGTVTSVKAEGFRSERSTRENDGEAAASSDPDLLIIEDLQYLPLGGVESLLQILDDRQACGRPTVITASAGPRHLQYRGEPYPSRLTSRLAGGLVVAVPLPSRASCTLALQEFLSEEGLTVPEPVIAHLVGAHRSLRALEGAVHQLVLLAKLDKKPFQTEPLLEHFQQQAPAEKSTVERIVQRVAKCFQVTPKDVRSRSRQRGVVVPRHVSMYLVRRLTPLSFQQIAAYFGDCDHGTVLHACRKMEKTIAADPQLGGTVRQLQDDLA
jgi:chromosomal replication initiator protein